MTPPSPTPDSGPSVAVDLHVHTGRYSQCAELVDPYGLAEHARRAGLAGLVLTEHDMFWQDEEIELLRRASPGLVIYRGIEVSARGCHLVVLGMREPAVLDRGSRLDDVVELAHAQEAAVILAHPFRDNDPRALPVDLVDAIEVASTSFTRGEAAAARALARRHRKPQVAGSDAHALARVGWAATLLPELPGDELELARAIRAGRGSPRAPHPFPD